MNDVPGVPSRTKDGLARLLAERSWSAAELSRRSGIPQADISRWLNGHRAVSRTRMSTLALVLGLPIDDLAAELGMPARPNTDTLAELTATANEALHRLELAEAEMRKRAIALRHHGIETGALRQTILDLRRRVAEVETECDVLRAKLAARMAQEDGGE